MDTDLILLERFIEEHPRQAAQAIEALEDAEVSAFIEEIPVELAARLISLMNIYKVAKCLKLVKMNLALEILERSDSQKTELLLRQANEDFRNELLGRLPSKLSAAMRQKLEYPAYSIGSLMVPLGFLLRKDMIVKDAIKVLKKEKEGILSNVCVVEEDGALAGMASIHSLLLANGTDQISAVMKTETPTFLANMPVESVKNHPAWHENRIIPVTDSSGKLVGNLTFEAAQRNNMETGREQAKSVMETGSALGELYLIGLTAFLQSVSKGD